MSFKKTMKWRDFNSVLKQGLNNFTNNPNASEVDILDTLYDQMTQQTDQQKVGPIGQPTAQTPPAFPEDKITVQRDPGAFASQNSGPDLREEWIENERRMLKPSYNPNKNPENGLKTMEYNIERDYKPEQNYLALRHQEITPVDNLNISNQMRRKKWQETLDFNPDNGHFISPRNPQDAFLRKFETPQQTRQRMDGYYYTDSAPSGMDEQEYQRQKAEKEDFYQARIIRDAFDRVVEDELAQIENADDRKARHLREEHDINAVILGEDEGYRDVLTGHLQNKAQLLEKLTANRARLNIVAENQNQYAQNLGEFTDDPSEILGLDQATELIQYVSSPAITSDAGKGEVTYLRPGMVNIDLNKAYEDLEYDPDGRSELVNIITSPFDAYSADSIISNVNGEVTELFGENGINNDSDAFRHAYGSYLFSKEFGPDQAKMFTDAHETDPIFSGYLKNSPKGTKEENLMDLYNNKVGRDLYQKHKNSNKSPKEIILDALNTGQLQTRPFQIRQKK